MESFDRATFTALAPAGWTGEKLANKTWRVLCRCEWQFDDAVSELAQSELDEKIVKAALNLWCNITAWERADEEKITRELVCEKCGHINHIKA